MRALAALLALALAPAVWAAPPEVRAFRATDVTPRSFRIVWLTGEAGTATLRLFEAPDCINEIFSVTLTPFPTRSGNSQIVQAAQQKGVMLVEAAGLEPDTEYCVQTVTTSVLTNLTTTAPAEPLRVTTERLTTRGRDTGTVLTAFENDLVKLSITSSTPGEPTHGALLLLQATGASSPLTAWVGDGIDDDGDPGTETVLALFDLNNLYDATTGESLDLLGDGSEDLAAIVLGSPEDYVEAIGRLLPVDAGLSEVIEPVTCRDAPTTVCKGKLGDSDNDGTVSAADADAVQDHVIGLVPILGCVVCADAVFDLARDMKDALAIGQSASGLRELP